MNTIILSMIFVVMFSFPAFAKIKIMTTTENIASVVEYIGGSFVEVQSLCKGSQDPHFLEAKPSYIFKLSKTDLLISVGAGLEVGWLPLVISGSHNPKLREGQSNHLSLSKFISLREKRSRNNITRAHGDVHPEGNPHFMLSPIESVNAARAIMNKLIVVDSKNKTEYENNFKVYSTKIDELIVKWKKQIPRGLKVVSYHRTLSYFYADFGIDNINVLEPKPGIPPAASHIISLIKQMKKEKVSKIIVENYFDDTIAKRIKKDIPSVQIKNVAVAVHGTQGVNNILDLYDHLIKAMGDNRGSH